MRVDFTMAQYGFTAAAGAEDAAKVSDLDGAASENGQASSSGDTVDISGEGRALAMKMSSLKAGEASAQENQGGGSAMASGLSNEEDDSSGDEAAVERIKDQIKELQQELQDVQKDDSLTDKQKQIKTMEINQRLMELNEQLTKLTGASFAGAIQGTRASSGSSSLT